MKLFGNSKNGKHTSGGGHPHPEQELHEVEEPSVPAQPPRGEPARHTVRQDTAPLPRVTAVPPSKQKEEDVFNSIVEAVGMADQLPSEPDPVPQPKRPEPVPPQPPVKRPEPEELFPDLEAPDEEPREGKSGGKKALIIVGAVLGVLLLIALAAVVVVKLWITEPNIVPDNTLPPTVTQDPNDTDSNGEDPVTNPGTGRKKGSYTFAIAGIDVASGNTDVMLVGKLDTVEGSLNVVSIPRDTLMNYGTYRINSAYAIGKNSGGSGADNLKKELKKLMGFEVDSYAIVDTKAVEELIDAIGGVEFDVPINMDYDDPYQNLSIHIKKGPQRLSGADAVKVLRYRHNYPGGDIQRIGVQQDFFKAMAKQFLNLGNIPNLPAALEVYEKRVETNLEPKNVAWYLTQALALDFEKIQFMTLPGNTEGSINGGSYVFIYVDEWLQMVNDYLNPFYEEITENHVSIKTSTNGTSFTYTAGANR